jgi:hypothetical protein
MSFNGLVGDMCAHDLKLALHEKDAP